MDATKRGAFEKMPNDTIGIPFVGDRSVIRDPWVAFRIIRADLRDGGSTDA